MEKRSFDRLGESKIDFHIYRGGKVTILYKGEAQMSAALEKRSFAIGVTIDGNFGRRIRKTVMRMGPRQQALREHETGPETTLARR